MVQHVEHIQLELLFCRKLPVSSSCGHRGVRRDRCLVVSSSFALLLRLLLPPLALTLF